MFALSPAFLAASAGAGNPSAVALLAGMVAWWSLDDNAANTTFTDSHGSHPLTNRNAGSGVNTSTQSSATAKKGRSWNPNRTDNAGAVCPRSDTALDMVTDAIHTFGGWFKTGLTVATTAFIIGRVGSAFAKLHLWIFIDSADSIIKARYSADGTTAAVTVSSGVTVDSSEWHLIVVSYNRTAGTLTLRLRKETTGGLASASSALGAAISNASNNCNFTIGEGYENDTTVDAGNNRNGVFFADECFYCTAAMDDTIFDYLFNAGAGKSYSELVADA